MKAFVMHGIGKASNRLASAINGAALPSTAASSAAS